MDDFTMKAGRGSNNADQEANRAVLPYLKNYGIIDQKCTLAAVRDVDLRELAMRWNIKTYDKKSKKQMKTELLWAALANTVANIAPRKDTSSRAMAISTASFDSFQYPIEERKPAAIKEMKNYFGLPPYAFPISSHALVYQCRKPMVSELMDDSREIESAEAHDHKLMNHGSEKEMKHSHHNHHHSLPSRNSYSAQRKVAHALLTMANNENMIPHFIHKGGVDALIKLIADCADLEVMTTCAMCLVQAAGTAEGIYCQPLIAKQILSSISTLIERGDANIKLQCSRALANLTYVSETEEGLVMGGIFSVVSTLIAGQARPDTSAYSLISLCNVAPALSGDNYEASIKMYMQTAKKLDISHHYPGALLIATILTDLSRMHQYSSLLCEESALPLFLHMMECYPEEDMINKCTEAFMNLSLLKKNRREISSCGIANHLDNILSICSAQTRSYVLFMVGSLLSSGLFHDRMAREDIISNMLDNLLDPLQPKQFAAVAFCISQLAQVEYSAQVMVSCEVIRIVLGMMRQSPPDAAPFLWTMLVNLSQQPVFYGKIVAEAKILFQELYDEATRGVHKEAIAQLALNLSLHDELSHHMTHDEIQMFVNTLKCLFAVENITVRNLALTALVNFSNYCKSSRVGLLGQDLIELLENAGVHDVMANVQYAALINNISIEENCCVRLIEAGALKLLVSLQDSFTNTQFTYDNTKRQRNSGIGAALSPQKSVSIHNVDDAMASLNLAESGELGKCLTAACFHNLSLKRAVLGPGMMSTMMKLMKNSKSTRPLHCVRALANMSAHPKSKIALAKERKLVPLLTSLMTCGCDEADRVQHYSSLVLCNIFATKVEVGLVQELIKTGTVVDLIVVTLLRINSVVTKESLCKALFNLLSRSEFRLEFVNQLDMLSAMIELAKIENVELLELCVRAMYNITCELPTGNYTAKLTSLKVPTILVSRLVSSRRIPGAKPTTTIKILCGMALANVSFDKNLQRDLVMDNKVPDACKCIASLDSDESVYCAVVTLFNLSFLANCTTMSDSAAVPLLTMAIARGPVLCTQLAVAALTNFSLYAEFREQLTAVAIGEMVKVISSPQLHVAIKLDAIKFIYNMVTTYAAAKAVAVEADCAAAIWKILKSQDDDVILISMGRILKELCSVADEIPLHRKLLADGIMNTLLRLAKIEIPLLKLDVSCCIFSLTTGGGDIMKVLKWDAVDVLFWLTLHDCLQLYDPIRRNVSRSLRNFSSEAKLADHLVKEERFMPVLKALAKSKNEDVLWQAAGTIYNLMSIAATKTVIVSKGAVPLIFEIASSGYDSVRHVCSANLHMVSENMPDLEDPAVLELVLCLLEADADKFSELGERATEPIVFSFGGTTLLGTSFEHEATNFTATWLTLTCEVDVVFTPYQLMVPKGTGSTIAVKPMTASAMSLTPHKKLLSKDFGEFVSIAESMGIPPACGFNGSPSGDHLHDLDNNLVSPALMPPQPQQQHLHHAHSQSHMRGSSGHLQPMDSWQSGRSSAEHPMADSSCTVDLSASESYVPIQPEMASSIVFPKIHKSKRVVPSDTLGAIKTSIAKQSQRL